MRIVAESVALQARGHKMVIACQPDSQILREAKAAGLLTVLAARSHAIPRAAPAGFRAELGTTDLPHLESIALGQSCVGEA
jgi:hypothetical protein